MYIYLLFAILAFLLLTLIMLNRILNNIVRLIQLIKNTSKYNEINEGIENDEILVKLINDQNINGAIKRYRVLTGAELKEAIEYVNKIAHKNV